MTMLIRRVEELARLRRRARARQIAAELKTLLRGTSVEVEDARVLVSGRGISKRWLIDPSLRFFRGGFK